MSLAKYNPFSKIFNKHDDGLVPSDWFSRGFSFSPDLDVVDEKDKYIVKAEIPGVNPKELKISYRNGVLVLKGEKKHEDEKRDKDYYHYECSYGSFIRSVPLDDEVDDRKIDASCKNGVLKITLPKKTDASSKAISIKVQ